MDGHVEFGHLTPDGVTNVRYISRASLLACPRMMLVPEHYRSDGTCRCNVATECPDCNGEGDVPGLADPHLLFPCRSCDGVGLQGWSGGYDDSPCDDVGHHTWFEVCRPAGRAIEQCAICRITRTAPDTE